MSLIVRCSALGALMANPTAAAAKAGELLSVGAKTAIRKLAAQTIFGIDFEVDSKHMAKGREVEQEAIAMFNRVNGLRLVKNAERRTVGHLTGECDLVLPRQGFDIKSSWSVATFPLCEADATDSDYEWQARGYMRLWDADEWTVAYCLVSTPEHLIGFEPMQMHVVDHIPEHMRVTTWTIKRDAEKEALMLAKLEAANAYHLRVIAEFDQSHPEPALLAA